MPSLEFETRQPSAPDLLTNALSGSQLLSGELFSRLRGESRRGLGEAHASFLFRVVSSPAIGL
jgi:hypothetical protein